MPVIDIDDLPEPTSDDHSVVVRLAGPDLDLDSIHEVTLALFAAFEDHPDCRYDGHEWEIDGDHAHFYFYGAEADAIFAAAAPLLREKLAGETVTVHLRYGALRDKTAQTRIIPLTPAH